MISRFYFPIKNLVAILYSICRNISLVARFLIFFYLSDILSLLILKLLFNLSRITKLFKVEIVSILVAFVFLVPVGWFS